MITGKIKPLVALMIIYLATPAQALAYVDPGAGSFLLQGVLGGIAACLALGGAYWRKVKAYFSRFGHPRSSSDSD